VRYRYGEGRNHLVMVKMGAQGTPPNGTTLSAVPTHTLPGGVVVVAPVGRLDSLSSRTLESALLGLVGEGRARLVVDLRAVTYISSTGLKVLLTGLRQAQRSGGGLMLANLGPRVREVFEISGFDTVFSLLTSVEDAAARL
jgi:anti-anti-sigma factor